MEQQIIHSLNELRGKITSQSRLFQLLYKKGSPASEDAYKAIMQASSEIKEKFVYISDVNQVRDIHPAYGIKTVPSLLEFERGKLKNVIRGNQSSEFYKAIFEDIVFMGKAGKEGRPIKRVIVYTTPTCSWCNTMKSYLRKNHIRFTEIDVSRDQEKAREMVRRSGQQGVPQAEINGEIVVGFDQAKINRLLEIDS